MAGRSLSAEAALGSVLADGERSDDSEDCLMSSDEEFELDLALGGEEVAADDDDDEQISPQLSDEPSAEENFSGEMSDGDDSDDSDYDAREREPRRPVARLPRAAAPARRARGRTVTVRGRGRGRGGGGRRGRGGSGRGAPAGAGPLPENITESHSWDTQDTQPEIPAFTPHREPGAHFPDNFQPTRELDFFQLYFSMEMIGAIVNFTNTYATMKIADYNSYQSEDGSWNYCTEQEMLKLIALIIYQGIVKLPRLKMYWSTASLLHGTWARAMIPTYLRFKALLAFLHVVDPDSENPDDKLRKVRFLNDHMVERCKALFQPGQKIAVDERMVKSKARFGFKQYIQNKPTKFGFKVFALCDSALHYLYNFKVYTGRSQANQVERGLAHNVVLELVSPLFGQGYQLFTDNFYTSHKLFTELRDQHGTVAAGTCQVNRKGFPDVLRNAKAYQHRAKRGDMRYVRSSDVLSLQWMDKRCVTVLSTMHDANASIQVNRKVKQGGEVLNVVVQKPKVIDDYNFAMGGVDQFDQYISTYQVLRKTRKYWKTLYFDSIDVAIVNAHVLFKLWVAQNPGQISVAADYDQLDFRLALIRQLASIDDATPVPLLVRKGRPAAANPAQLPPGPHLPVHLDKRRECWHCKEPGKDARKSVFACSVCTTRKGQPKPFCITPERNCFLDFHSHQ